MHLNGSLTLIGLGASPKRSALTGGKMIGFFRRLLKDKRGNVLVVTAACLPLVIGAAGLATDTIEWTLWKRQLQRAADSAAIAGVYDRENATGAVTTNTPTAVCNDLTINLHTWMKLQSSATPCGASSAVGSYYSISYPSDSGSMVDQVQVTLHVQQALPFSSFFSSFGFTAPVITATATAASISTGTPCMWGLSKTGTAINNTGNTTVTAPTCIFYSDSSATNAAAATGSSSVTLKAIAAVGSIQQSSDWHGPNNTSATYMPGSPYLADPFSNITPDPADMKCAGHTDKKGNWVYDSLDESTNMSDATQQYKDSSGVVHTGIPNCWTSLSTSSSNKTGMTVPSNFGPIYLDANSAHGGTGSVDMQGKFTCSGCTIVMTNSDSSTTASIGTWSANAQSKTNITAPTTGTYSGIAIFQDRRATASNSDTINGGDNNVINGSVYLPKAKLTINGTGTASSLCAMWISYFIDFSGNSGISIASPDDTACSGYGLPSSSAVKMVRLVA